MVRKRPTTPSSAGAGLPGPASASRTTRRHQRAPRRTATPGRVGGRNFASAGHALAVGLVCFSIWLVFDAEQLFNNADSASPLGARRTVAMSVLRPIAYAERHLELNHVVESADRAIGRLSPSTPGGSAISSVTTTTLAPVTTTTPKGSKGSKGSKVTSTSSTTTTVPTFAQPTAADPVTILEIGDSIGEDLGIGLADVLGSHPDVKVEQTAVGNTGLADPGYYNWPVNLSNELAEYHPKIVVMLFGGNDWQPFLTGPNTAAQPGTPYWQKAYGARVAQMIRLATDAGAKVFWVGLPPMSASSGLPAAMAPGLNAVYQSEAEANGATYVSIWSEFSNAEGQYAEFLPNAEGQLVAVRDPDGVHLAPPAGCDLAATITVKAIDSTLDIKL